MYLRFLRVDPNYFAFLSGLFASVGISLLTGVLSSDDLPGRWRVLVASAGFSLVASFTWATLAWQLAAIERLAIAEAPGFVSSDAAWDTLAGTKRVRLIFSFGIAVLCAAVGIAILLYR